MDKLVFAQKFPFSPKAKEALKQLNIDVNNIPQSAIKKAALIISRAFTNNPYYFDPLASKENIEIELMAFPVAKMLVSLMKTPNLPQKLALFYHKSTFNYLIESKNFNDEATELMQDLRIDFKFFEGKGFFVEVSLLDFLQIHFIDEEIKLVNLPVVNGRVLLNNNSFARFLAEVAYQRIIDSLPIPAEEIPKSFQALARSIDSQLVVVEKKNFDLKLSGKIDSTLFPPCMLNLYNNQLGGKKLSYIERLTLASFLYQLGMNREEMLLVFSKSPDFDKKIAMYHIEKIFEKQLSAPACRKIAEQGLRVKECEKECTVKHPLQYYISKLRLKNRKSNFQKSIAFEKSAALQKNSVKNFSGVN